MKVPVYLLTVTILTIAENCNSQPVKFIKTDLVERPRRHLDGFHHHVPNFPSYNLQFFRSPVSSWAHQQPPVETSFLPHFPTEFYVSPDFSDGLAYPDPLLLTGIQAKRAALYLYSKELFFDEIPHMRALLRVQDERRKNGLSGNRLGSIRVLSSLDREKFGGSGFGHF